VPGTGLILERARKGRGEEPSVLADIPPDRRLAERDPVHLHMVISPKYAVSKVVETSKSVTSRQLKEKFPHVLRNVYWDGGRGWPRGVFASTVGINEATTRQHVRHQGE